MHLSRDLLLLDILIFVEIMKEMILCVASWNAKCRRHLFKEKLNLCILVAGQDVFSCGFMGAIMGGVLCASQVLNRNVWQDLVNLKQSIAKNK